MNLTLQHEICELFHGHVPKDIIVKIYRVEYIYIYISGTKQSLIVLNVLYSITHRSIILKLHPQQVLLLLPLDSPMELVRSGWTMSSVVALRLDS